VDNGYAQDKVTDRGTKTDYEYLKTVNDAFVMKAWGKDLDPTGGSKVSSAFLPYLIFVSRTIPRPATPYSLSDSPPLPTLSYQTHHHQIQSQNNQLTHRRSASSPTPTRNSQRHSKPTSTPPPSSATSAASAMHLPPKTARSLKSLSNLTTRQ